MIRGPNTLKLIRIGADFVARYDFDKGEVMIRNYWPNPKGTGPVEMTIKTADLKELAECVLGGAHQ